MERSRYSLAMIRKMRVTSAVEFQVFTFHYLALFVGQHMALLRKMCDSGMTVGVISSNLAISACEKEGQWEQPWVLRHKM